MFLPLNDNSDGGTSIFALPVPDSNGAGNDSDKTPPEPQQETPNPALPGFCDSTDGQGQSPLKTPLNASLPQGSISFCVDGVPGQKGRPKFARIGKFVRTYTPQKTMQFENLIKVSFSQAHPGWMPLSKEYAVAVDLTAYFPPPKSIPRWKQEAIDAGYWPKLSRPDGDNIQKAVLDALNSIAFHDDSQVAEGRFRKIYADRPRLEVKISYRRIPQNQKEWKEYQGHGIEIHA